LSLCRHRHRRRRSSSARWRWPTRCGSSTGFNCAAASRSGSSAMAASSRFWPSAPRRCPPTAPPVLGTGNPETSCAWHLKAPGPIRTAAVDVWPWMSLHSAAISA